MKWTNIALGASLGCSGAWASVNPILEAKFAIRANSADHKNMGHTKHHPIENHNGSTPIASMFARFLDRRQAGRCGADGGGARCPDNQCCSQYGYCGNEFEFCGDIVGCQPDFGRCGNAPPVTSSSAVVPSSTPTPTPTPTPSSSSTPVIPSSSSIATSSASSVSPPLPSGTLIVSPNGQCGNSTTCAGSPFGNCCSLFYFCGSGSEYCGTGCNPAFGTCGSAPPISSSSIPVPSSSPPPSSTPPPPSSTPTPSPSSSIPVSSSPTSSAPAQPTSTIPVSQDGTCGNGVTCTGSTFGRCCSDYFYCGNQDDYCRPAFGCRPEWGTCG